MIQIQICLNHVLVAKYKRPTGQFHDANSLTVIKSDGHHMRLGKLFPTTERDLFATELFFSKLKVCILAK